MVGRWSEAATLKFVYFYKTHECLWNPRSELYNSKDARNFAYVNLVLQMKMPDFDLRAAKVKIKNLRAHYITELKKVRYAAAMGDRYEPTLYWFKEMDSFLRDTIGDIPSLHQPEVITADSIYDSSSIYESGFGDDEDSMEKPTPFLHISETRSLAPPKKNNKSYTSTTSSGGRGGGSGGAPFHHRRVTSSSSYRPGPASSKRRRKQKEAILGEEYADEFEAFGRSVSAQLRKLSLSRALRAQSKIQAILTEERIHDLEATAAAAAASPLPPPPPSLPVPLPLHLPPPPAAVLPTSPHDLGFGLGVGGTSSTISLTNTTDSGVDSGIDTTTSSSSSSSSSTASAASSVAGGLPSPTTPTSIDSISMPLGGIPTTTESTTTSSSSSSSSCIKELKEFRKSVPDPTPAQTPPPNSDVIIKAECELITLDEDDPFEGH